MNADAPFVQNGSYFYLLVPSHCPFCQSSLNCRCLGDSLTFQEGGNYDYCLESVLPHYKTLQGKRALCELLILGHLNR